MLKPPFLSVGKTNLTILRRGSGTYTNGYWVEQTTPTEIAIVANVQPGLKWNELQHLPEGERGRKTLRVYTDFELRTRKEGPDGYDADRFIWDGELYEVMHVPPAYKMGVLNHTKALCARVEVT